MKNFVNLIFLNLLTKVCLLVVIVLIIGGCFFRPNCDKDKYIVSRSLFIKPLLKLNGIYISKNLKGSFFLYSDGKFHNHSTNFPVGAEFWNSPAEGIEEINNDWFFNRKDGWGDYYTNDDSIFIQFFNYHSQEFCKRWVYEMRGKILNDSTIKMSYLFSDNGNDTLQSGPNTFSFYQTSIKPDSTIGWVYKKEWYKNNLHPSRK